MDTQTREFRRRFENDIPDNILSLFFEDENINQILNHQIGRELIYPILRIISITIRCVADSDDISEKRKAICKLQSERLVCEDFVNIIKAKIGKIESLGEEYKKNVLTEDERIILLKKLGREKHAIRAKILLGHDNFYYAYKTSVADELRKYLDGKINYYIKKVYEGEGGVGGDTYDVCNTIKRGWIDRLRNRERDLIDTRKIIYGEKR